MSIVSGIVLYFVIWILTFLVALPIRIETQGEAGRVVPGTHHGSPERHHLKRKVWISTLIAALIWAVVAWIIISGTLTVRDIDIFGRMGPAAS